MGKRLLDSKSWKKLFLWDKRWIWKSKGLRKSYKNWKRSKQLEKCNNMLKYQNNLSETIEIQIIKTVGKSKSLSKIKEPSKSFLLISIRVWIWQFLENLSKDNLRTINSDSG